MVGGWPIGGREAVCRVQYFSCANKLIKIRRYTYLSLLNKHMVLLPVPGTPLYTYDTCTKIKNTRLRMKHSRAPVRNYTTQNRDIRICQSVASRELIFFLASFFSVFLLWTVEVRHTHLIPPSFSFKIRSGVTYCCSTL